MNYEIEFLAVGNASKAGDAIIIRYGDGDFDLMIVDGGHTETGREIVDHIHNLYGRNAIVADVVLTHADGDHACGLRTVLEELDVRRLWLNVPALHAEAARPFLQG